jgi:hypothetical protein
MEDANVLVKYWHEKGHEALKIYQKLSACIVELKIKISLSAKVLEALAVIVTYPFKEFLDCP